MRGYYLLVATPIKCVKNINAKNTHIFIRVKRSKIGKKNILNEPDRPKNERGEHFICDTHNVT